MLEAEIQKTENLKVDIEAKLAAIRKSDAETSHLLAQAELSRAVARKTTMETEMLAHELDRKLLERGIVKLATTHVSFTVLLSEDNVAMGLMLERDGKPLLVPTDQDTTALIERLRQECPQVFEQDEDE